MSTSQRRQFQDVFANVSSASAALTPGLLTTNTSEIVTVAVPGAAVGDVVSVSAGASAQTAGIQVTGRCDAAGVVSIEFSNTSAGSLTPVSSTYTVVSCTLDAKMSL